MRSDARAARALVGRICDVEQQPFPWFPVHLAHNPNLVFALYEGRPHEDAPHVTRYDRDQPRKTTVAEVAESSTRAQYFRDGPPRDTTALYWVCIANAASSSAPRSHHTRSAA